MKAMQACHGVDKSPDAARAIGQNRPHRPLEGGITRAQLAPRWRGISDDDLATQTGFIISRRA